MAQPGTLYLPAQASPLTFLVFAKLEATVSQRNKQTNKRKKQSNKVEVTVERQIWWYLLAWKSSANVLNAAWQYMTSALPPEQKHNNNNNRRQQLSCDGAHPRPETLLFNLIKIFLSSHQAGAMKCICCWCMWCTACIQGFGIAAAGRKCFKLKSSVHNKNASSGASK